MAKSNKYKCSLVEYLIFLASLTFKGGPLGEHCFITQSKLILVNSLNDLIYSV